MFGFRCRAHMQKHTRKNRHSLRVFIYNQSNRSQRLSQPKNHKKWSAAREPVSSKEDREEVRTRRIWRKKQTDLSLPQSADTGPGGSSENSALPDGDVTGVA